MAMPSKEIMNRVFENFYAEVAETSGIPESRLRPFSKRLFLRDVKNIIGGKDGWQDIEIPQLVYEIQTTINI